MSRGERDQQRLQNDINFGTAMEVPVMKILERFFRKPLEKTNTYDRYDCESEDTMFEIKCRDMSSTTYQETMIGINKSKAKRLNKPLYFVFCYYDGLYYTEYDPNVFDTYNVRNVSAVRTNGAKYCMPNYFIPVRHLSRIEATAEELKDLECVRLKYGKVSKDIPRGVCLL